MKYPAITLLSAFLALSVTPLNLRGQLLERDVILAVAADIATEPGKLLGVGPRPDSAGKIIPHLKLVDTTIACKKGPGTCTGFFPQLQKSSQYTGRDGNGGTVTAGR
jgi:hypothetical protein